MEWALTDSRWARDGEWSARRFRAQYVQLRGQQRRGGRQSSRGPSIAEQRRASREYAELLERQRLEVERRFV